MTKKVDGVSENHQKIVVASAVIIVAFLIIISVTGVATDPDPETEYSPDLWYMYIYRFQTLIGGFLAVGAAFITIQQMRKSDKSADQRHFDLIKLQMRPIMESRAALRTTHVRYVEKFIAEGKRHVVDLEGHEMMGGKYYVEGDADALIYGSIFKNLVFLRDKISADSWVEHSYGLSGRTRSGVDLIRGELKSLVDTYRVKVFEDADGGEVLDVKNHADIKMVRSVKNKLKAIIAILEGVIADLSNEEVV